MANTTTAHRESAADREAWTGHGFATPPANITATENGYLIEIEMPGVNKDGLEITVERDELTVTGRRHSELPQGELLYCESALADFRRVFELGPDIDSGKISAEMAQGVVKLRLPKAEQAKPRKIKVSG
jgi:HSP20 family protein